MFLQETFVVQDCIFYNTLKTNASSYFENKGASIQWTSNGLYVANQQGNWGKVFLKTSISQNTILEYDIVSGSGSPPVYTEYNQQYADASIDGIQQLNMSSGHVKMEWENNTLKTYVGTTLKNTQTCNYQNAYWTFWTGGARSFTIANLKIKAL